MDRELLDVGWAWKASVAKAVQAWHQALLDEARRSSADASITLAEPPSDRVVERIAGDRGDCDALRGDFVASDSRELLLMVSTSSGVVASSQRVWHLGSE